MAPSQRILLIDDNEELLSLPQLWLQRLGFTVLTARGGPEALTIAARDHVDMVVVDYKMPEMDGGQVAEEMRRIKPTMPILMYSGALEELPDRALEFVDEFVSKQEPFSNLLFHITNVRLRAHRRKRAFLRHPISLSFLVIYDEAPGSAVFYGESKDMSEGGIGGILDEELEMPVDGKVLLRLAISSQNTLTAGALLRHRAGRRCGFQFAGLTPAQLQTIRTSLNRRVL